MPGFLVLAAVALAVAYLAVRAARSYFAMRGTRVVTCPENHQKAGVAVGAGRAVLTGLYRAPELRLESCTRWPERQGCGQACLSEVAAAGEGCLVRHILTRWYEGKNCAYCGQPIGEIDWAARKPALMTPARISIEWAQVPAERLDEVLATHQAVCFTCHVTNTFAREHPELIVDRTARHA